MHGVKRTAQCCGCVSQCTMLRGRQMLNAACMRAMGIVCLRVMRMGRQHVCRSMSMQCMCTGMLCMHAMSGCMHMQCQRKGGKCRARCMPIRSRKYGLRGIRNDGGRQRRRNGGYGGAYGGGCVGCGCGGGAYAARRGAMCMCAWVGWVRLCYVNGYGCGS